MYVCMYVCIHAGYLCDCGHQSTNFAWKNKFERKNNVFFFFSLLFRRVLEKIEFHTKNSSSIFF